MTFVAFVLMNHKGRMVRDSPWRHGQTKESLGFPSFWASPDSLVNGGVLVADHDGLNIGNLTPFSLSFTKKI